MGVPNCRSLPPLRQKKVAKVGHGELGNNGRGLPPLRQKKVAKVGHGELGNVVTSHPCDRNPPRRTQRWGTGIGVQPLRNRFKGREP
jgi:hypothetical protein